MTDTTQARLGKGLLSGYPIFYLQGAEESRMKELLAEQARSHYGNDQSLLLWSVSRGFYNQTGVITEPITDPVAALRHIADSPRKAFYLMQDLPALLADDPRLVRALRDLYQELAGRDTYLFLSYPELILPESLKKQIFLILLGIPTEAELIRHIGQIAEASAVAVQLNEEWRYQCAVAMKGMSLDEAGHLITRLIREGKTDLNTALPEILEEKSYALLKEGCLQYINKSVQLDQVGGLENLKEWVDSRRSLFTRQAFESGIPLPAGILFMGVSGCGKSMAAKVIAGAWNLPLVRLDMNLVLSGAYGAPEYAFDHALRVAEEIAPLVLWIDEMENSFGYDLHGGGGNNNIFASFLTWMQEKPPTVFVVATANRIEKLPAEVIRKGRFDQLFFLDLPTEDERKAILSIHIKAAGGALDKFNLNLLAAVTKNWSGAEIEQVVKAARIRAYQDKREFSDQDVVWNTARMVPLSRTMEEQIKQLRLWSVNRATPASKKAEV
ncbi:MAG: AAA family ATPase [Parasulfuritortus sp.]|jgi:SpoVK/Ycf46/Vps4 family AAA+-type ATPase|nr:AAA family ATPase [Parasulfuritortus sp.]